MKICNYCTSKILGEICTKTWAGSSSDYDIESLKCLCKQVSVEPTPSV